jgi:hypothetical protein
MQKNPFFLSTLKIAGTMLSISRNQCLILEIGFPIFAATDLLEVRTNRPKRKSWHPPKKFCPAKVK